MPVENDTSHQNGQEDTGGGGGNGNVRSETSSVPPRPATEPNATTTIVNGTHPKVASTTAEEQLAQDSPKDAKKSRVKLGVPASRLASLASCWPRHVAPLTATVGKHVES
ncbi:uncharacterized protein [Procambarus clarkii]|uniref:uncharacterized protein n=1 Tax=Procambarus clarkii TaxID=6728 RepID=UPI003743F208